MKENASAPPAQNVAAVSTATSGEARTTIAAVSAGAVSTAISNTIATIA